MEWVTANVQIFSRTRAGGAGVFVPERGELDTKLTFFRPPHAEALPNAQMQAILSFRDKMRDKT